MRLHVSFSVAAFILFTFLSATSIPCAEKSVEEHLDDINRLPAAERATALAEGAKKERELVSLKWGDRAVELVNLFNKLLLHQGE